MGLETIPRPRGSELDRYVTRLITRLIVVLVLGTALPARAALPQRDMAEIGVTPPPQASLPLDLPLQGEDGTTKPIQHWLGTRPTVWVLADYTCETLCGPVISIVSDALARSGLRPVADFRLVVIGLDPNDTAADAARMRQAQTGLTDNAAYFLKGDAGAIGALSKALGFRSVYDRDNDQFAHPAAAFVVAPDGRLARTLPGLEVDPVTLRLAIIEAGKGNIGTIADHIRLLCYGYDPAHGNYSVAIGRILAVTATATIMVLALLIGLLLRHERAERPRGSPRLTAQSRMPTTDWRRRMSARPKA